MLRASPHATDLDDRAYADDLRVLLRFLEIVGKTLRRHDAPHCRQLPAHPGGGGHPHRRVAAALGPARGGRGALGGAGHVGDLPAGRGPEECGEDVRGNDDRSGSGR